MAAAEQRKLSIPSCLTEVTTDWVAELLYSVVGVPRPAATAGTHNGITLLQIRARATEPGFRESCHVTAKCSSQSDRTHHMLVEIVPTDPDLRELIVRHNLFAKDLLLHKEILPLLQDYVRGRRSLEQKVDVSFCVPRLLHGDYDPETGDGVLVFEDPKGFAVRDPQLMLLNAADVAEVVHNMATFHAICVAFQTTEEVKLEQRFPVLVQEGGCTWFHEDMTHFLAEMYSTCRDFINSIPGQQELGRWFESKMAHPEQYHRAGQSAPNKLRSIIHGDLWHNNLFFRNNSNNNNTNQQQQREMIITDWQMCHMGSATNDLCFLLFSSCTPSYRKEHWEEALQRYYDCFVATLRSLAVTERELSVSFEEFQVSVKASIPVSLFFCGNVQDFDVHAQAANARELTATEEDEEGDEEAFRKLQSCFDLSSKDNDSGSKSRNEFPNSGEEQQGGIVMSFSSTDDEISTVPEIPEEGDGEIVVSALLPAHKALSKVPTIASDRELANMEEEMKQQRSKRTKMDARKARAIRRKLYLDLYTEAAKKGFI